MEIKHNIFLKYDGYFKQYHFIRNFELKCKILSRQHLADGRYDYFGDRVQTMRHGTYGIMFSISQNKVLSIYQGSWGSDTFHGKGNLYTISHPTSKQKMLRLMQGQWIDGLLHGKGVIKYFNLNRNEWQTSYEGDFKNGQKWGFGIERESTNLYRGEFSKGCRSGTGRIEETNGNFFDGHYQKGFLVGQSFVSVGDTFIITDNDNNKKIYKKHENIQQFTLNFSQLIHQIVSVNK